MGSVREHPGSIVPESLDEIEVRENSKFSEVWERTKTGVGVETAV